MFSGHFGVGLASKRAAPAVSLATLLLAAQWLDVLWPLFLIAGIEHVRIVPGITRMSPFDFYDYPVSHSGLAALGWGLGFALVHFAFRRSARASVLLGAVVFSHWVLDFITHRPDLPLWPGGPLVGLGLWNTPAAEWPIEAAIYFGGAALYLTGTRARDRIGRYAAWVFVLFVPVTHLAAGLSPPPPNMQAAAWTTLVGVVLILLWARWLDRHRTPIALG
jgi:hypothetical protein